MRRAPQIYSEKLIQLAMSLVMSMVAMACYSYLDAYMLATSPDIQIYLDNAAPHKKARSSPYPAYVWVSCLFTSLKK